MPPRRNPLREAARHLASADPVMRRLVARVGPCTMRAERTPHFQSLAEAIVYQQLAGAAASTIWGRFVALYPGARLPSPAVVSRTPLARLRSAGLSGSKAASILDLAAHAADGRLPLARIARMSDDDVLEAVTEVRGIGPWTAHMYLIFRLGRPDVLPTGDYGVRKAAQRAYRLRALPEPDRLTRLAEPWRPWRSVAAWYLWRSLDL
jgi:3-methyladenine DNA glycosylase/8-oxoguanine DNA glycosylase